MEYIMYAVHLLALVLITVVAGGLLNHYMLQRGFAYNLYLTYLFIPVVGVTLYLVGGFTLWTLKGGRHNDSIEFVGVVVVVEQVGEQRKNICRRLSCACLRTRNHIFAIEYHRDSLFLHRGTFVKMHIPQCIQHFIC